MKFLVYEMNWLDIIFDYLKLNNTIQNNVNN